MRKQPFSNMDGDSRDLLLFDYLEGNLTKERASMLEEALATDPDMAAELDGWKESFIVQDFYSITTLEKQLLKEPAKIYNISGPATAFMLVLIVSLFSFTPVNKRANSDHFKDTLRITISQAVPELSSSKTFTEKLSGEKSVSQAESSKANAEMIALAKVPIQESANKKLTLLPEISPSSPDFTATTELISLTFDGIEKVNKKQQIQPKQVSRKQQRQILRMKNKALQQKRTNEFIKGNRPYVVPLDTKNF